jgi:hypothetical protein
VSSPASNTTKDRAGSVAVFALDALALQGGGRDWSLDNLPVGALLATLHAGSFGARFGTALLLQDMNRDGTDELLVSAPLLSPGLGNLRSSLGGCS